MSILRRLPDRYHPFISLLSFSTKVKMARSSGKLSPRFLHLVRPMDDNTRAFLGLLWSGKHVWWREKRQVEEPNGRRWETLRWQDEHEWEVKVQLWLTMTRAETAPYIQTLQFNFKIQQRGEKKQKAVVLNHTFLHMMRFIRNSLHREREIITENFKKGGRNFRHAINFNRHIDISVAKTKLSLVIFTIQE